MITRQCLYCSNELTQNAKPSQRFCSKSCSNRNRTLSAETRAKIGRNSKAAKEAIGYVAGHNEPRFRFWSKQHPYSKVWFKNCTACQKLFVARTEFKKCCSPECRHSITTKNAHLKTHITYETTHELVSFDSRWEVKVAQLLDELKIEWKRPHKAIRWVDDLQCTRTYLPDFWIPSKGLYLDVKNPYKIATDHRKLEIVKTIIPLIVLPLEEMLSMVRNWINGAP